MMKPNDKGAIQSPVNHMVGVRGALQRLAAYPLPAETRLALQEANQHLARLELYLTESVEQTRLAALNRISGVLGVSLNVNAVLTQVMDAVIELTHAERGFLMLVDSDSGGLRLKAARNIEHETLERKDMEVSRTVIRTVVESGISVVTTDAQSDPRFARQESVVYYALHSIMCTPLRVRGQIIGVIYVDNRAQKGVFTDGDLNLLNAFAAQAAIAIDNARLYTQTDQALSARIAELETLAKVDRELNAQLDLEHVLGMAQRWAVEGSGAFQSWVALFEAETHTLRLAAGAAEALTLALDGPEVAQALQASQAQAFLPQPDQPGRVIVPMRYTDQPIGVILVEGPAAFGEIALQFLDRLAGRAASAIQNARLYQAVQDANQAKTKFVSVVTHELRLPMTSIKGYTDLLRQGAAGPVNEMQQNFLNVIRNNVERMSTLVSDLSDISRIETGRLNLSLARLALESPVQESVNSLRTKIDEKQQTLEVNLPADLPKVYADPGRVVQILNNLLSNAHKYTPSGGKVTLRACSENAGVRVEVCDTGIGISPQDQAQLFTQFFRSEDPDVREQQGWGLGLSVTRRLVELMGGEIGVQSTLKQGSTFWFTLPTAPEP